ncbi:MAG TPA: hypothetical protein VFU47_14835, partial [Armatimonadota bacterium]|nr:hypothetical protein [Armatimonadota bacterium]
MAAVALAAALPLLSSGRPVSARPEAADLRGTYVGGCSSRSGQALPSDLSIYAQSGRQIAARLSIAAVYPDVVVSGVCAANGRFTLVGRAGTGPDRVQIKLRGFFSPPLEGTPGSLSGEYLITGARRDRGTFRLAGG